MLNYVKTYQIFFITIGPVLQASPHIPILQIHSLFFSSPEKTRTPSDDNQTGQNKMQ